MKIKCFEDMDTALFDLGSKNPSETREVSEDIYLDLDESGNVVSITVEHASLRSGLSEVSFIRMKDANQALGATP